MLTTTAKRRARLVQTLGAFALALAAAMTSFVPATSASAAEGDTTIGVATRPAGADGRPDGRTGFSYKADPGQRVDDQVLVGNTGTQRQDFTVYATDAFNAENGEFSFLATDQTPTAIGTWVTFDNGQDRIQFSLEPNEVRLLKFTVGFPADATPGDHVGGLVASVVEEGQQVSLDRRVATSMYARVSGDLHPQLAITSFDAQYQGDWWNPFNGAVKIRYTVVNQGNVALAANTTASVSTWFWIPATGAQGGANPTLLPGNSGSYEFTIQGVGQWGYLNPAVRVSPFVDSQDKDLQLFVTQVSRDGVAWALPWTILILGALVAGYFLYRRWRRQRDEARAQEWVDYMERSKEAELAGAVKASDS